MKVQSAVHDGMTVEELRAHNRGVRIEMDVSGISRGVPVDGVIWSHIRRACGDAISSDLSSYERTSAALDAMARDCTADIMEVLKRAGLGIGSLKDAERYRALKPRLIGADFAHESFGQVICLQMKEGEEIGVSLDDFCDRAITADAKVTG